MTVRAPRSAARRLECSWSASKPPRTIPLAVLTSLLLAALPGRAAEADGDRSAAVRLATHASAAYKAGHFQEALAQFDEAYRVYPAPPLLLNLSRTELKLGQCDEALRYAQMYGKTANPDVAAAGETPVSWIAQLESACPLVEIRSDPAGAAITIVGTPRADGSPTPWSGRLEAGSYSIVLRKAGYLDQSQTLNVAAGPPITASFTLAPEPPKAIVVVPIVVSPPAEPPVTARATPLQLAAVPAPPGQAVPAAATRRPMPPLKIAGWTGVAVGGAALVTAVALGISVNSDKASLTEFSSSRTGTAVQKEIQSIDGRAVGTNVLYGIGGVLAAAGAVVVIVF